jgi:hypothetical protein
MDEDLANFEAWYACVLATLYPNDKAGIAVLMLSLPLAERYMRQRNKVGPEAGLTDDCMRTLVAILPALRDVATARAFWTVYRNGFLHQATLSTVARGGSALPVGWLTHNSGEPFVIRQDGSFQVQPVLLSDAIVRAIRADFEVFAGTAAGAPRLARVERLDPVTIPSTFLGTRSPP